MKNNPEDEDAIEKLSKFSKVPNMVRQEMDKHKKRAKIEGKISKDENPEVVDCEKEKSEEQAGAGASGGFFSAFSKIGGMSGMKSSNTTENISGAAGEGSPKEDSEEAEDKRKETWGNSLSNAFNKVGKAATDYSKGNLLVMRT